MARPKERFCKRGHDTDLCGRDKNFACKECRREDDRRRSPGRHKKRYVPKPPTHNLEWERARVQAWLAIVAVDKMIENKSTQQRRKDFNKRYERLEAEVPMP